MDDIRKACSEKYRIPLLVDSYLANGKWELDRDETLFFGERIKINFKRASGCFQIVVPQENVRLLLEKKYAVMILKGFARYCVVKGYNFYPNITYLIDVLSY